MKKKWLAVALAATMALACTVGATGCNEKEGYASVKFLYAGSAETLLAYKNLVDTFNSTVGETEKINVKINPMAESGLFGALTQRLPQPSGPDVVAITDEFFKSQCRYLEDLTGYFDGEFLAGLYPNVESRYHYNIQTTTSHSNDPLYGLPVMNDPTVLYYNKTALEAIGVKCISVEEEDIDAFNAGSPDKNGKTKAQYGIPDHITVPKKGFYRSIKPFHPNADEHNGSSWSKAITGEVLVFNDSIAMNWDEIEDVGLMCTRDRNSTSATDYGYYTEWWFDYGWSVGGDCIQDVSGSGNWTLSLSSELPNYIVNEGKTYTGLITETAYQAGDTLDMRDIVAANKGDAISYYTDDATCFYYTVNGAQATVRADMATKVADGTLTELPSMRTAFSRFCYLAGVGGINVCPYPSAFNFTPSETYFSDGSLAFLVELISNYDYIKENASFEWGIARMPKYKEYTDPTDPACDTVKAEGKSAYHSIGHGLSVRKGTKVKDQAIKFVTWMMTDGQNYLAENGLCSSRIQDREKMIANTVYGNGIFVADSMQEARAGDWWYMPDRSWIDNWAIPLNNRVRYGDLALNEFLYQYITKSNQSLENYKVKS